MRASSAFNPEMAMRIGLRPEDLQEFRASAPGHRLGPSQRLYGIGMGKTGTNALATVFHGIPCAHEADADRIIEAVLGYDRRNVSWQSLLSIAVERDRQLSLAVDVSNLNVFLVDLLVWLDPCAKFVLTVREPRSWLDSILNHYLLRPPTDRWRAFAAFRFGGSNAARPPEESALDDLGLHSLQGYLSYWRRHNEHALASVPSERLMVVRYDSIAQEAARIAEFAGIGPDRIRRDLIHEYRNRDKRPVLDLIDATYLEAQIRLHCEPVMTQLAARMTGDSVPRANASARRHTHG
jgi:hypothetical protein